MEVRIIGICPVMDRINDDGVYTGETPLFWVYYPEARKILSKSEVFNHRKNDAARLTYDDIFHKRFFSSRIVKESNKYDRKISEYKEGIDALLEAEKIKEEIFNLEHDLWEY
jgi:gliding motility associated protien GldN